jgi:hypothetical protein
VFVHGFEGNLGRPWPRVESALTQLGLDGFHIAGRQHVVVDVDPASCLRKQLARREHECSCGERFQQFPA